ncbi:Glutaredoxin domain-containing protein [Heracleum sosnowskyi]|uniref:Glutaredoxin domain-containing protein n=1 Tax=Heracleum sosnowskyi TaxID=360622 RepID=A0AAD8M4P7_9APIA|nr:Glutaredoxin domain-containing protein [Heracleum sosnowskyi]
MAMSKAQDLVSSNAVVVFSKTSCSYCNSVMKLFNDLGVTYKTYELDVEISQWTNQRTVPNVFIGGKYIGGCDSVFALRRSEKLVPLLTDAKALSGSGSSQS